MNKKRIISVVSIILVVALLATVLAACNAKDYEKKLTDKGYHVESLTAEDLGIESSVEFILGATNKKLDNVTIIKFAETKDAKDFENKMKENIGDSEKHKVSRLSKTVFFGTVQGVKDAK